MTARTDRPIAIGLTGSIGAGKSAALAAFARHGAAVLDSDAVVHALYLRPAVQAAVTGRFGPAVVLSDGSIDRAALGRIVFADPAALAWLEALLHPLVGEASERWTERERARADPPRVLVQEVQLLFEGDGAHGFDRTLLIDAPDTVRHARIAARGSLARVAEREARLLPAAERRLLADDVIVNDGDLVALDDAIRLYLDRL